jgi:hypothetical protein
MGKIEVSMTFHRKVLIASVVVLVISTAIGSFMFLRPNASSKPSNELKYWPISRGYGREVLKAVGRVFDRLGHHEANDDDDDWDIMWTYEYAFDTHSKRLKDLKPHQLINHFPGMTFLTNKMSVSLRKLKAS